MFDKSALQNTVVGLLTSIGQQYTLFKQTSSSYDPALGSVTNTEAEFKFTGGVFNYTTKGSGDGIVYNKLIEQGDRKVLLVPRSDGVVPAAANWTILIDGERWGVVAVEVVKPANTVYLIELQVRKR